MPYITFVQI